MRVLVAYDGSPCAHAALEDLAFAGLPEKGEAMVLSLGHVYSRVLERASAGAAYGIAEWAMPPYDVEELTKAETAATTRRAENGASSLRTILPAWEITADAMVDSPTSSIVVKAEAWGADLIVVGSHGRSALGRAVLGSVSQTVLVYATRSVRVGRAPHRTGGVTRLLIGIDGSVESASAVSAVVQRTWPRGTEARVIAVVESSDPLANGAEVTWKDQPGSVKSLPHLWVWHAVNRVARELREAGLDAQPTVWEGDPKRVLLHEAERWGADCIFLGAKGLSRVSRFLLGSVSQAVAARAHCSVEVVRQPS